MSRKGLIPDRLSQIYSYNRSPTVKNASYTVINFFLIFVH